MTDFPTAAELRARLDQAKKRTTDSELMALRTRVTRAIERGASGVYVDTLLPTTEQRLKELGYTVQRYSGDQRDPDVKPWVSVNW